LRGKTIRWFKFCPPLVFGLLAVLLALPTFHAFSSADPGDTG